MMSNPPVPPTFDPPQHHPLTLAFAVAALQNGAGGNVFAAEAASGATSQDAQQPFFTTGTSTARTGFAVPPTTSVSMMPPSSSVVPPLTTTTATSTNNTTNTMKKQDSKKNNDDDEEDNAEKRLARSRERNREHARRTRLRKKAQLEALQSKVKGLEAERQVLKQSIENCGIASILLNLSASNSSNITNNATSSVIDEAAIIETCTSAKTTTFTEALLAAGGKRKRFLSDLSDAMDMKPSQQQAASVKVSIDGRDTTLALIGGNHHNHNSNTSTNANNTTGHIGSVAKGSVNWKTGVYTTEDGAQRQLTPDQLESLRRERNRMHAKMTRDRKKCFIATIERTIQDLENENNRMRQVLAKLSSSSSSTATTSAETTGTGSATTTSMVTPIASPRLGSREGPCLQQQPTTTTTSTPATTVESSNTSSPEGVAAASTLVGFYGSEQQPPPAKQPRIAHGFSLND